MTSSIVKKRGRPVGSSKAPTVCPPRETIKNPNGKSTTYIYYSPCVLTTGKTVYHKRTHTHYYEEKPADGKFRRKGVSRDTPHKQKVRLEKEKKKLVAELVKSLLSDTSTERTKSVYGFLGLNPINPLPLVQV